MWVLLRSLDDPDHIEFPSDYDHKATRQLFDELVTRLDAAFACRTDVDRHVEDASLHASVRLPAAATATGEVLVVCVSNFGTLATVAVTNPGAYSQDEFEARLVARDATRIYAALDSLGYRVAPEAPSGRTTTDRARSGVLVLDTPQRGGLATSTISDVQFFDPTSRSSGMRPWRAPGAERVRGDADRRASWRKAG